MSLPLPHSLGRVRATRCPQREEKWSLGGQGAEEEGEREEYAIVPHFPFFSFSAHLGQRPKMHLLSDEEGLMDEGGGEESVIALLQGREGRDGGWMRIEGGQTKMAQEQDSPHIQYKDCELYAGNFFLLL